MSHADRTSNNVDLFHPASHYDSPDDVLKGAKLSTDEKRLILSSWASDMYAVESRPSLREVPGIAQRLRLDDILATLKRLDDDTDPPPRGGLAMRLPRFSKLDCPAPNEAQRFRARQLATSPHRSMQTSRTQNPAPWTREENVRRYRRLLNTNLTEIERSFIERRLSEELQG